MTETASDERDEREQVLAQHEMFAAVLAEITASPDEEYGGFPGLIQALEATWDALKELLENAIDLLIDRKEFWQEYGVIPLQGEALDLSLIHI